ncbi:Flagellar basal-body rod modification protein FlgD [hydrothermal vent metagenome]|uniref:Flagellar basal-body rod modification protein FlgD n=1 Tax=hydrothermal vent metagenome TaxID=652676 RepID=A0A3B1CB94_9ZZZZ
MIVSPPSDTTGITYTEKPEYAKDKGDNMGKDQFLTLLIAQIKHQDPMNPMENTEFTAQMAQFSSLEQLFSINDNLGSLTAATAATNSAQGMNLIGKEVTVQGHSVHVTGGQASDIGFSLPDLAGEVSINVEDQAGNIVRTIELGPRGAGEHSIKWDGLNNNGKPLADSLYNYTVSATDISGNLVEANTYTRGVVDKVSFDNNVGYIHIGNKKYMLGEVLEISEPASSLASATNTNTNANQQATDDLSQEGII